MGQPIAAVAADYSSVDAGDGQDRLFNLFGGNRKPSFNLLGGLKPGKGGGGRPSYKPRPSYGAPKPSYKPNNPRSGQFKCRLQIFLSSNPGPPVATESLKPQLSAVATESLKPQPLVVDMACPKLLPSAVGTVSLRVQLSAQGTEVLPQPPPSVHLSLGTTSTPSPPLTVTRLRTDQTGRALRPTRIVTALRSPPVITITSYR